jgi:hypothetical protein
MPAFVGFENCRATDAVWPGSNYVVPVKETNTYGDPEEPRSG